MIQNYSNVVKFLLSIIIGYFIGNYISNECLNDLCIIQFN